MYLFRAQSLLATSEPGSAEKDIKRAHELKPFNSEVLLTYIKVLRALKKFSEAAPLARQCTELAPHQNSCWDLRGDLAFDLKKYPEAADHFAVAVKNSPENYEIRTKLGNVLLLSDRPAEADVQFDRVLKIKPNHLEALKAWVPSLLARQEYDTAARVFQVYHAANPNELWSAVEYAKLMSLVGSDKKAARIMGVTRKANRSDVSRMYHAHYLEKSGDLGGAEDELEDIKDENLAVNYNLGIVYWNMKKFEKASRAWGKVKPDSPSFPKSRFGLALVFEQQGKIADAIAELSRISAPEPLKTDVARYLNHLNSLKDRTPTSEATPGPTFQHQLEWELPNI